MPLVRRSIICLFAPLRICGDFKSPECVRGNSVMFKSIANRTDDQSLLSFHFDRYFDFNKQDLQLIKLITDIKHARFYT